MPTIATTEISRPRSWDEFEDICWSLYRRDWWPDPHAQRNGRARQQQDGVDFYGQPPRLSGGYAGVQCKRYAIGTLRMAHVVEEVKKAEGFRPVLKEHTIATTDRRDAKLQEKVRLLTEERTKAGLFPVYIMFWEDIADGLVEPESRYLLRKYYPEQFAGLVGSLTQEELQKACHNLTAGLVADLRRGTTLISRDIDAELEAFFRSNSRVCVISGPSGVGKTMLLTQQAQRLLANGWVALLARGKTFSLEHLAELVTQQELGWPSAPSWEQTLVLPWRVELDDQLSGFALLLDDLDVAEFDVVSRDLTVLLDAVRDIPASRLKVIVSCRDSTAERLRLDLEPAALIGLSPAQHENAIWEVSVGRFNEGELDRALASISAIELLENRRAGEWADPHVESVRGILRHPSAFGIYARLRTQGEAPAVRGLSWSTLVERYLGTALRQAGQQCQRHVEFLNRKLVELAHLARERKQRDFLVPDHVVRDKMPDLLVDQTDPSRSPYAALSDSNILVEEHPDSRRRSIGFEFADLGCYLLSFGLEDEWQKGSDSKSQHERIGDWLREAYEFSPLLDAILAWIDRLADDPGDSTLHLLLRALVADTSFRSDVVFALMRPAVLKAILQVLRDAEPSDTYMYKKAATAIRPTAETLEEVRKRLQDPDPKLRALAAELAGKYADTQSVVPIIGLLDDQDDDVLDAAHAALSALGEAAVADLVGLVGDAMQPPKRRARCLDALRAIGLRNPQVSAALGRCMTDAQNTNDEDLLTSGVLAAAHLRDSAYVPVALSCLASSNWRLAQAAAKLLTEIAEPQYLEPLLKSLRTWAAPSDQPGRSFTVRQLLAAAAKTGQSEASDAMLDVLSQALDGASALAPVEVYWMAGKMELPEVYRALLRDLVHHLTQSQAPGIIWPAVRHLGSAWAPTQLDALADAARELAKQNKPLGAAVLNALIETIKSGGKHPLRDHHAQLSGLLLLAKSQQPDFVVQASQLLAYAPWSLDIRISEMLWVASEPLAEPALLAKLGSLAPNDKQAAYARSQVLRALGTCGHQAGAAAVMEYLESENEVGLYIPEECICPLLWRSVLDPAAVVQLARDSQASAPGRSAALIALAISDVSAHKDLFLHMAAEADNPTLRGYAIRMLGFSNDTTVVPMLVTELGSTPHLFVAEQAAEALSRLGARETASAIEQTVLRFASQELSPALIEAMAELGQLSSLPILLELLPRFRFGHFRHELIEALGFFWPDPRAQNGVMEQLRIWRGGNYDSGDQQPAIRALAYADPDALVQHAIRLYGAGRLDRSARSELTRHVSGIVTKCSRNSDVLGLLRLLATDSYLPVREELGQRLGRLDPSVCQTLYEEMSGAASPWERACAVHMLGFWDSDPGSIESARFAPEFVVRYAGDVAAKARSRRLALQSLVERYNVSDGVGRVAAYLALQEQGDEQSVWLLDEKVHEDSTPHIFLRQLAGDIQNKIRDQRRERAREEEELLKDAGTVRFD